MRKCFNKDFKSKQESIFSSIRHFDEEGEVFGETGRNTIKLFKLDDFIINVKSFKVPNAINKIAYRFFRKSKAQRSFEYAEHLISMRVGTPQPVAYFEETSVLAFLRSYYVSEQLDYDLTFRELVHQPDLSDHEKILRAFTRFTHDLHEKKIEFLDHSPGNTLIKSNGDKYDFFLVDLNRMNFKEMDFNSRMNNFARLTPKKEMVRVMANEYAKISKKSEPEVFDKMWSYTQDFQEKFRRKRRIKKVLKFWKR